MLGDIVNDTLGTVAHDIEVERSRAATGHRFNITLRVTGGSESDSRSGLTSIMVPGEARVATYGTAEGEGKAAGDSPTVSVGSGVTRTIMALVNVADGVWCALRVGTYNEPDGVITNVSTLEDRVGDGELD